MATSFIRLARRRLPRTTSITMTAAIAPVSMPTVSRMTGQFTGSSIEESPRSKPLELNC
jgi:hypothetical protein